MSREKQIEEMKNEVCICCSKLMDCHEHLKGICGFMKMIEMLYDIGYRKQEWISVDERLPDGDGDFLVWNDFHGIIVGHYFAIGKYFISKACTVTHWMPLPEPLKGD